MLGTRSVWIWDFYSFQILVPQGGASDHECFGLQTMWFTNRSTWQNSVSVCRLSACGDTCESSHFFHSSTHVAIFSKIIEQIKFMIPGNTVFAYAKWDTLGMGPKPNTKFIYVFCIPYVHSLRQCSTTVVTILCILTVTCHTVSCRIFCLNWSCGCWTSVEFLSILD